MSSFKDFVAARKAKQKAAPAPKAPEPKASAPKAPAPKVSAPKAAAVAALVAAAATAPAPDMLALPETPYLDNTQPKLAAALRAAGDPVALRNAEAWMETQAAPAAPPKPTPPPRSEKPTRVLLLCYANNFMYDRDRAKKVVWNWSSRATGAIVCTNALELGVDVGDLGATVHLGHPGGVANLRQQSGRAGRRGGASAAIIVCFDSPLDQFYARCGAGLLSRPSEPAALEIANEIVLGDHLALAAAEKPLEATDRAYFSVPRGADAAEEARGGAAYDAAAAARLADRALEKDGAALRAVPR